MENFIAYERYSNISKEVRVWFTKEECDKFVKTFLKNHHKERGTFRFMDVTVTFDRTMDLTPFEDSNFLTTRFYSDHMVTLMRLNIDYEDAKKFLFTILTCSIIAESNMIDTKMQDLIKSREILFKRLTDQIKITILAKNEYRSALTPDVDVLPSGFRMIYQLLVDDDLRRYDFMYSKDFETSRKDKMEIGLRLMEKGNLFRKESRGMSKTFETSSKNRVAVYFPKENDNIGDGRYSYPRAAVHTARELSIFMREKDMISALGLSIGWGGLMNSNCLSSFFESMKADDVKLPGYTRLLEDPSIMCLVTIPRVRPHQYLKLSRAEALIFVVFSMINDLNISLIELKKNPSSPFKGNFTADTMSKLSNLGIQMNDIESYTNAFLYAAKICIKNVRRKGVITSAASKVLKSLILFGKRVALSPEQFDDTITSDLERHVISEYSSHMTTIEDGPSTSA